MIILKMISKKNSLKIKKTLFKNKLLKMKINKSQGLYLTSKIKTVN